MKLRIEKWWLRWKIIFNCVFLVIFALFTPTFTILQVLYDESTSIRPDKNKLLLSIPVYQFSTLEQSSRQFKSSIMFENSERLH